MARNFCILGKEKKFGTRYNVAYIINKQGRPDLVGYNVNISPLLCKSAARMGQYEELHLSLEGS
jgi:hypothetical protein